MRSLMKLHTQMEKFFGPLPELDIKVIFKLDYRGVFGLLGIGTIYLPLFWLMHPTDGVPTKSA